MRQGRDKDVQLNGIWRLCSVPQYRAFHSLRFPEALLNLHDKQDVLKKKKMSEGLLILLVHQIPARYIPRGAPGLQNKW